MNKKIVDQGYTVVYDKTDGSVGFIGIDDHSGGYPYFRDSIEPRNVSNKIANAFHLLREGRGMKSYYGNNKVKFDTMRVVKVEQVLTEIKEEEDQILFDETMKKLSQAEIDVIKRYLK